MKNYAPAWILSVLGTLLMAVELMSNATSRFIGETLNPAQWLFNVDWFRTGLAQQIDDIDTSIAITIAAGLIGTFIWPSIIAGCFWTPHVLKNYSYGFVTVSLVSVAVGIYIGNWDFSTMIWALLLALPVLSGAFFLAVFSRRVLGPA